MTFSCVYKTIYELSQEAYDTGKTYIQTDIYITYSHTLTLSSSCRACQFNLSLISSGNTATLSARSSQYFSLIAVSFVACSCGQGGGITPPNKWPAPSCSCLTKWVTSSRRTPVQPSSHAAINSHYVWKHFVLFSVSKLHSIECVHTPHLPEQWMTIYFFPYSSSEKKGYLVIVHKVKYVLCKYFPQNWRLWVGIILHPRSSYIQIHMALISW